MSEPTDEPRGLVADQDDAIARMLRLVGMRADVPEERTARVRRAVLDECRAVARRRRAVRRGLGVGAALAAAAVLVLTVRIMWSRPESAPVVVDFASVERIEGDGVSIQGAGRSSVVTAAPGAALAVGDTLETGDRGRVGVRLAQGASLRFDRATQARVASLEAIELTEGAVYVDSGQGSPPLEIRTALGVIRDIGTQFEVRLETGSLRVRVRTGMVEVHRGGTLTTARQGAELTVGPEGVSSRDVDPYGSLWAWTIGLTPAFEIDGRSLSAFLEHLCREQGWTLAYATPSLAREASGIILHGSIQGLQPTDALDVALSTSGLVHRLDGGELLVRPTSQP